MILRGDFTSETLRMSTNIQVLAPDSGSEPYRIVYLLHGMRGDQGTWIDNTMLPVFAKRYNAIFVMPEVCRSFYADLKYGRKYYTYVSEELPKVCRKFFNISQRREDTAVMGCSMGGFGALLLALSKPEQYGFCGAIAPACLFPKNMLDTLRTDPAPWLKTGPEAREIFIDLKVMYGDGLEYDANYDIIDWLRNFSADKPKPKIYTTCGIEDELRNDSLGLWDAMRNTTFDFVYEEWAGDHDWYFFNDALKKTIEYWYKRASKN